MGMTDKQFAAFIRQLMWRIKQLEKLIEETGSEEAKKEMEEILNDLQKSLED